MTLSFKKAFPSLSTGCCDDKIYCILFDDTGQALKWTGSIYEWFSYTLATHSDFAIPLTEDSNQTQWWDAEIASGSYNIGETPDNARWYVEYWQAAVALTYDRATDTFLSAEPFLCDLGGRVETILTQKQRDKISVLQPHISIAYDANDEVIRYVAYLEFNGSQYQNVTSCTVEVFDRIDQSTILSITNNVPLPAGPSNVFVGQSNLTIDRPDEVYPVKCSIVHDKGTSETIVPLTVWD